MPEEQKDFKKRNIAFEKRISEINEDDVRVKVIGAVVSIDKQSFSCIIDDNGSTITVILPDDSLLQRIHVGKVVRVIGIVLKYEQGFELKAELVQDFSNLDMDSYFKFLERKKETSETLFGV